MFRGQFWVAVRLPSMWSFCYKAIMLQYTRLVPQQHHSNLSYLFFFFHCTGHHSFLHLKITMWIRMSVRITLEILQWLAFVLSSHTKQIVLFVPCLPEVGRHLGKTILLLKHYYSGYEDGSVWKVLLIQAWGRVWVKFLVTTWKGVLWGTVIILVLGTQGQENLSSLTPTSLA